MRGAVYSRLKVAKKEQPDTGATHKTDSQFRAILHSLPDTGAGGPGPDAI